MKGVHVLEGSARFCTAAPGKDFILILEHKTPDGENTSGVLISRAEPPPAVPGQYRVAALSRGEVFSGSYFSHARRAGLREAFITSGGSLIITDASSDHLKGGVVLATQGLDLNKRQLNGATAEVVLTFHALRGGWSRDGVCRPVSSGG
jgi:hypothetical protein